MLIASLLLAATLQAGPERAITRAPQDASPYHQSIHAVSGGDESSLIVWSEGGQTERIPFTPPSIVAARIGPDGERIDTSPIPIANNVTHISATARGVDRWLIVWLRENDVVARFVNDDGTTSDVIPIASSLLGIPRVAFDGSRFLIVFWRNNSLTALPLDADGNPIGAPQVLDAHDEYISLDVAPRDSGFEVVFARRWPDQTHTIEAMRVDRDAKPVAYRWLDRTPAPLRNVHVIVDDDDLVATWATNEQVFLAREGEPLRVLTQRGSAPAELLLVAGEPVAVLRQEFGLLFYGEDGNVRAVAGSGGRRIGSSGATVFGDRVLAAYGALITLGFQDTEADIFTAVFDSSFGRVAPDTRLDLDAALQLSPAVARNAHGESMVVWVEHGTIELGSALRVNRLDALGRRIGNPQRGGYATHESARPSIASDGEHYLVVNGTMIHPVSREGVISFHDVRVPAVGSMYSCTTWNGNEYLVAYHDLDSSSQQGVAGYVRVARVSRDGQFISAEPISTERQLNSPIACASTDTTSLFAWGGGDAVHAALVSDGGTISAPFLVGSGRTFAVAARDDRFAVAMTSSGTGLQFITRATVSPEGTVMIANGSTVGGSGDVAIAPTRDGFLLAWGNGDLYAQELDVDAHPISDVIPLSTEPGVERNVVLAGGETPFAMYMRDVKPHLDPRWRIFTRTLTRGAQRVRAVRP